MDIRGLGWDHDKIIRTFNSADAEAIRKIKIRAEEQRIFLHGHMKSLVFLLSGVLIIRD
jgi:hypothetical protein